MRGSPPSHPQLSHVEHSLTIHPPPQSAATATTTATVLYKKKKNSNDSQPSPYSSWEGRKEVSFPLPPLPSMKRRRRGVAVILVLPYRTGLLWLKWDQQGEGLTSGNPTTTTLNEKEDTVGVPVASSYQGRDKKVLRCLAYPIHPSHPSHPPPPSIHSIDPSTPSEGRYRHSRVPPSPSRTG